MVLLSSSSSSSSRPFVFLTPPDVNPITQKARSVPIINPFDRHGRVFFFSWLGFMVAFLSWYAFPPLLTITIREDLGMSQNDVANSNIVALLATFLLRIVVGSLCDKFGPRYVFVGTLLCGAIPTAMAGLVTGPGGLIALRFFVGILGATFVPCQVWCTAFFDENVVGTANALAAGLGNAGGGITYFVMPAVFDSLVRSRGLTDHVAWRVAYVVPFILITAVAVAMLLLCDDTPTGKWSERHLVIAGEPRSPPSERAVAQDDPKSASLDGPTAKEMWPSNAPETAPREAVVCLPPTVHGFLSILFAPAALALAASYACSFGSELAIESVLGSYYDQTFPVLGQTGSGSWAAMFGLLNVVFRPLGGMAGDAIYRHTHSVWGKKLLVTFLGVIMGVFQLAIGLASPHRESLMFGLFAGLAFFVEACNGAIFSVVPHVYPQANGSVSGLVGASGNLGGIVFAIVFRYNGQAYATALWIIGIISMALNVAVGWVNPVPRHAAT